jgi:hypothetical protein
MHRHECNKHNYLCINDSLKILFPCENQGVTGKKGQKCRPHCVAIVSHNGNGDEEADNSSEELVAAAECNLKRQTWPPKDHFEKLLKATYLHDPYHVKHELKDCTMIKKFITSGTLSRGSKPGGDQGGNRVAPIPEEAEVMTVFG